MAEVARARDVSWVLTHGEPKADDLLRTEAGLVLLDWDTAMVAPAARDLWMIDLGAGEQVAAYSERTGLA